MSAESFYALLAAVRASRVRRRQAATEYELEQVREARDKAESAWFGERMLASYSRKLDDQPSPFPTWGELYAELSIPPEAPARAGKGRPATDYPWDSIRRVVKELLKPGPVNKKFIASQGHVSTKVVGRVEALIEAGAFSLKGRELVVDGKGADFGEFGETISILALEVAHGLR